MSTQDSDISTPIEPSTISHRDVALSLQAKLSHLLSSILTSESLLGNSILELSTC